ncbi:YtrH family sporulation protein [Bacillus salitolerans]|uniref:YtrH family sporulation protein n=1 Tax=Bacillus salitolerans TaxID=1437434 RepID=A0ABW4LSJ5_9BACI
MGEKTGFIVFFFNSYFIALGVILGGCIVGGLGAFFVGNPPLLTMLRYASNLKIWAIVAAIGGSFDAFYSFEKGIFEANTRDIMKQFLVICSATGGAQTGALIISWLAHEDSNV